MNHTNKNKRIKLTPLSVLLTAAVVLTACLFLPGGSMPAEVQAEGDYDNKYNMLDDAGYLDFNLKLDDPEEFTSSEHPLESYDPDPLSWLYVGHMNKTANAANKGSYAVYNTMPSLSLKKASILDKENGIKDGEFQVNPISAPNTYTPPSEAIEGKKAVTVGTNAVSVKRGAGKDDIIVQLAIDYDSTDKKAEKDYIRLTPLKKDDSGYLQPMNEKIFTLSGPSVYGKLDTRAMRSVTAMTALDMDGDGMDELALYIADPARPRIQLFRVTDAGIEDYFTDENAWEKNVIDLSKLNAPEDPYQFNKGYGGSSVPIVGLASANMANAKTEDLVITVCKPSAAGGDNTRSFKSAVGIYRLFAEQGPENQFLTHLEYADETSGAALCMRYVSAQEVDADGNGTKELALGGYNADVSAGQLSDYALNFIIWENDSYHLLYNTPFFFSSGNMPGKTAREQFAMTGPAALTGARLSAASDKDYLLLENAVLAFKPKDTQTDANPRDKYAELRSGSFEIKKEVSSNNSDKQGGGSYIVQAVSGRFAAGSESGEQIALVLADCPAASASHNEISLSINWLWMEGGNVAQQSTNPEYVKQRDVNSCGTSVILCPVSNTGTADYYEYQGKNYGWSMPAPIVASAAVPYYNELGYYSGEPGRIRFGFAETFSQNGNAQVSLKAGVNLDLSMETGMEIFREEGKLGAKGGIDAGLNAALKGRFGQGAAREVIVEAVGSTEQVFVYAKPSIVYHYKKYVPKINVTQQMIDSYESQTGQQPARNDGTKLAAGDVIEEGWYDYFLTKQCTGAFTMMDMDTYSRLYEKYKDQKAVKADMKELFYEYKSGDPLTYPKDEASIKTWNPDGSASLAQLSKMAPVTPGTGQTVSFDRLQEETKAGGVSVGLEYSESRYAKGSIQLGLIAQADPDGQAGVHVGTVGETGVELSLGTSGKMGATVNTPETNNPNYGFEAQMATWATYTNVPAAMGFIVHGAIEGLPFPPSRPYVYESGKTWVMLAWDAPDPDTPRSADSYLIYQKNVINALNKDAPVKAGQQHFLVTGLDPDTEYEFQFAGIKHNIEGEKAAPVSAKTRPETDINLIQPQDQSGMVGDTVTFTTGVINLPAGLEAEYDWQKLQIGADGYTGTWEDIENANSDTYEVQIEDPGQDVSRYRVRVDIKEQTPGGSSEVKETIISRTASLYVDAQGTKQAANIELTLTDTEGRALPNYMSEYYIAAGTTVQILTNVLDSAGHRVAYGNVKFYYMKDGSLTSIGERTISNGGIDESVVFTAEAVGTYTVAAKFGGNDAFRPGQSPASVLHAGNEQKDYYSIGYEMNGGSNHPANPSAMGMVPPPVTLKDPSKTYSAFDGWYADPHFTEGPITILDAAALNALSDENHHLTLYAKWADTTYPILYELDGGTNHPENPDTYTVYDTVILKNPERAGYQFQGWYAQEQYTDQITALPLYDANHNPMAPDAVTVYAKWEPLTYTITYILNGGTNHPENPDAYTSQDENITLKDPAKDGAQFAGWYRNASFADADKTDTISKGSAGNLTLYARWAGLKKMEPFEKDKDGVWLIHNLQEFELMRDLVNSGQGTYAADPYLLCANIYGEGAVWNAPIGTDQTPFAGRFEGYDYTIDGLVMTGSPYQGIFGVIKEEGEVKNLQTINLSTDGNALKAGGIAAVNQGAIDKCSSGLNVGTSPFIHGNEIEDTEEYNNRINAKSLAGGVAGENTGSIRNSHSNALVRTEEVQGQAGGITGKNTGSIENGYNTGRVDAPQGKAAGIAGSNENGKLANLYNSGAVSGMEKGAIASQGTDGSVRACYYNDSSLEPIPGQTVDAQYKKGSEMKSKGFEDLLNTEAQSAGYNIWEQLNVKNDGYPRILSNILAADTSTSEGISVQTLKVHPASELRVTELDPDSGRYKEMQEKAKKDGAVLRRAWNINYMFQDGYSSDTEHIIRLHLPSDRKWNSSKIAVLHRIRAGEYETLNWTEENNTYIADSEGLSTFAVFEYKKKEEVPDPSGPDDPDVPDTPDRPDIPDDSPDTPDKPGIPNHASDQQNASYLPLNKTRTGDDTSMEIFFLLAAASAMTAIIIILKKRHNPS